MAQPNLQKVSALKKVNVREGVVLRPLEKTDATALLGILDDDPAIRERVGVAARLKSLQDVGKLIDREKNDPDIIRYVICEYDKVVGMVNFWRAGDYFGDKADPNDYGFGYFLAKSARGKGVVTSCLERLMDIATNSLDVHAFAVFCETDNTASSAVLEKVGFKPTGDAWTEKDHGWQEQKYQRDVTR